MESIIEFISQYYLFIIAALIVIFVLAGIVIANYSYDNFAEEYQKQIKNFTGFDGNALDILSFFASRKFGDKISVQIFAKKPNLPNGFYTPAKRTVNISNELAYSNSIAALAISAHELGHVCQHFESPKILEKNYKLLKVVKTLGFLNYPLFFGAIILLFTPYYVFTLVCLCIIILNFIIALSLKFHTIKIEKDASKRAVKLLKETGILTNSELGQVEKFLKAAKGTYIGDFFRALFAWTGLTRKTKIF